MVLRWGAKFPMLAAAAWVQAVAVVPAGARGLQRKLREAYPQMSPRDCELVERGMRQFFMACLRRKKQFVARPSRAADALWHEFFLHTQAYKGWCENALGFFLHRTPAELLGYRARHNRQRRC